MTVMQPIKKIRVDTRCQLRERESEAAIDHYAVLVGQGEELDPVVLFRDREKSLWLAHGFHRLKAYSRAKRSVIPAIVKDGELRDAIWFAAGANGKNAVQLTSEDRQKIVATLLADPEWAKLPDSEIASHVRCGHDRVREIRKALSARGAQMPDFRVVTRGGQRYEMRVPKKPMREMSAQEQAEAVRADEMVYQECRACGHKELCPNCNAPREDKAVRRAA